MTRLMKMLNRAAITASAVKRKVAEHVGERIRALRARHQPPLSATDLAQATGIDKGTISRIETGKQAKPRRATLTAIAHALGVGLAEIDDRYRTIEGGQETPQRDPILVGVGGGTRVEDSLRALLAYIRDLSGKRRRDFIHAITGLLTTLESPDLEARRGATPDHDRRGTDDDRNRDRRHAPRVRTK